MPKKVTVAGFGAVNFPDEMSDEDISIAIEREIVPQMLAARPRSAAAASITPEAPSALVRLGRGATDAVEGVQQRILQGVSALPQATPSIQELRAFASPEEQQLSDDELRARFAAQDPAANFTADVNEERALFDATRKASGQEGMDLWRMAGNAGMLAPLALAPGGRDAVGRAISGSLTGAGGGFLSFDPTNSPTQSVKNVAAGAALGGVLGPVAGWAGDQLGKLIGGAAARLKGMGREAVESAKPEKIIEAVPEMRELPPEVQKTLIAEAQEQVRKTGELNATEIARKANLVANNVKPTTAMVTRDAGQWTRERNLQKLEQAPDPQLSQFGGELRRIYDANDAALTERLASLRGGARGTQEAHGMTIMKNIDDLAGASQKQVSEIYNNVRASRGEELASDAKRTFEVYEELLDSPAADPVTEAVKRRLTRLGLIKDGKLTTESLTVTQAEGLRQFINQQPNVYGKSQIIRAIDEDVISGLGDDAFKDARKAAADRFGMLDNPATQRALNAWDELTQGKTAQNFIKSNVIDAAEQDVKSLLGTIEKMPGEQKQQTLDAMRAGVIQYLEQKSINPNSKKFSGAHLSNAIRDIGEGKLMRILGMQEYSKLQSLARASVDATFDPAYSAVNYSGTAPMLLSLTERARALPGVPLLISESAEKLAARRGYGNQLADALQASPTMRAPDLKLQELSRLLSSAAPVAANAALADRRQKPNRGN